MNRREFMTAATAAGALMSQAAAHTTASKRYSAVALQTLCDAVNQDASRESARARMKATIKKNHDAYRNS